MRCERLHATIRVAQCLRNQGLERESRAAKPLAKPLAGLACKGCETGELARTGRLGDEDVEELIRRTGRDDPAPEAKGVRMKTEHGRAIEAQNEPTKICRGCGRELPYSRFSDEPKRKDGKRAKCKQCVGERARELQRIKSEIYRETIKEKRAKELKALLGQQGSGHGRAAESPARDPGTPSTALTIDLTRYPELFEEIKRIAEAEERTPEAQVRYWLRNHLRARTNQEG